MVKFLVKNQQFVDVGGRIRLFHGVNIINKGEVLRDYTVPKGGSFSDISCRRDFLKFFEGIDEKLCVKMTDMGLNLVRLGITWEAVEPSIGKYDERFLAEVERIVDLFAKHNIYVVLDMHQDLYSGFGNGCGDGAPLWATLTEGRKYRFPRFGVWAEPYFFGKTVATAFDNFWRNTPVEGRGLIDRFADMWQHLVSRLKDKPNLFGYDFLNEPHPGSIGTKAFRKIAKKIVLMGLFSPKLRTLKLLKGLFSGDSALLLEQITPEVLDEATKPARAILAEFDRTVYADFINKMTASVREVTGQGIVTLSTGYWNNIGIPFGMPSVQSGGEVEPLQCFAPHSYDFVVDTPMYDFASDERVAYIFEEHRRAQQRLNVPVIMGEWGCYSEYGTAWLAHIDALYDMLDEYRWSNAYFCSLTNWSKPPLRRYLARAYPIAVPSDDFRFNYDRINAVFNLTFSQTTEGQFLTEIYLPSEPKEIITQCDYKIEHIGSCAFLLVLTTENKGDYSVTAKLKKNNKNFFSEI